MHALDVVTYGEAMAMFVADETGDLATVSHFTRRLAGAETNVAIGLARLGLRVGWLSRVGADSFGRFIRARVEAEGIDCSRVAIVAGQASGFLLKSKAENGADPLVEYFRKGSAASRLAPADFDPEYFLAARHLHASGVAAALSESSLAFAGLAMDFMRANDRSVSFDPNLRPTLWPSQAVMVEQLNWLAFKASWVLPGLGEGKILTGHERPHDIAGFYLERGVQLVVVKLGPDGAYFRDADDGFAAGLVSALLEGLPLERAVERGNRIGALAAQVAGDMEGLPTRAQLAAAGQS
ncbi:sugar kinase [Janthinobacterium sp. CG_23.3]|uniref:sugar kinase n=1 Tax=Janthinobacterium sp. CG_23.3 TaxID=3349634 RepID=UPI0038D4BC51